LLAATASLREEDTDPAVGRSYGEVTIPDEAGDREVAFQIAAQRLAAHRQRQHRSARRQAHAVLMAALCARQPELRDHLRGVTYRAISLGRRLGVSIDEIDEIALASELQGVGLLAAPESEAHTVEGERLIAVAVAFAAVTTPGPYRAGMNAGEALAELRRNSGTQFDPRVVEALAGDLAEEAAPVAVPA
jgi:HD-GYP domain-containing protein (c-di-GMP phosphodiesterase class II)